MSSQVAAVTDITQFLFKGWTGGTRVYNVLPTKQECMDGKGKCAIDGGHFYEGDMKDGLMHGSGKLLWADGTSYQGTFHQNQIKGKGVYNWPNGSHYEGEVLNGVRHGEGNFECKQLYGFFKLEELLIKEAGRKDYVMAMES